MYDIFFLSYYEPQSDSNWHALKSRFPHAKRINGIKGIDIAHKKAADKSNTAMFYTVDADTCIDATWDFSFVPKDWDKQYLHLWYSRNPINKLEYGYGGVKLWPKQIVLDYKSPWLDFTTSVGNLKIHDQVISTTKFNVSPFETWKSAFREAAKLSIILKTNIDDKDSNDRLQTWLNVKDDSEDFADWCILGANNGQKYVDENYDISVLNDFDRLKNLFDTVYGPQQIKSIFSALKPISITKDYPPSNWPKNADDFNLS